MYRTWRLDSHHFRAPDVQALRHHERAGLAWSENMRLKRHQEVGRRSGQVGASCRIEDRGVDRSNALNFKGFE